MAQVGVVGYIPPHYILPRWQMPPEDIVTQKVDLPDVPSDRKLSIKERKLIRYGTLCNDFTDIAKVASESDKSKAIADKYMLALSNELKSMKLSEAAKRKAKQKKVDMLKIYPKVSLLVAMQIKRERTLNKHRTGTLSVMMARGVRRSNTILGILQ
jgi:hypothetical protein